ncbi:MAG: hypothetical protein AB1489_37005 [Acidobacteriota bacterium]
MVYQILCSLVLLLLALASVAKAQDFDIQRYDIAAQLQPAAHSAQIQAKLLLINNTTQGRSGSLVNLKINKRAKVSAVQVDSTNAQFQQKDDDRQPELANVSINLPKPLAPAATATVTLTYTLELKESNSLAAINSGDLLLLPESFWVPVVHTPFAIYGLDVAPITINVTVGENERVQSDGARRAATTFEQTLLSQPLLLAGNFDEPVEIKTRNSSFEIVYYRGMSAVARKKAEALAAEGSQILDFYNQLLGMTAPPQIRIIASPRVANYAIGTTILLSEDQFRREPLDLETVEFLARALLRSKVGGDLIPRGRGWNIIYDALPAYLAGLYFEQRYGSAGGQEFFARRVRAYAPIAMAKTDGPLLFASTLDNNYSSAMLNKAPLILRLIEQQIGREKFLALVKELLSGSRKSILYDNFKRAVITVNKGLETFFDQWFDKIVEPDFIIGIPVAAEGGWKCALRNLGTGDVQVKILAITEKGEQLTETTLLPSQGRSEVFFKTANKITTVEVDPEKLYPQTNYDNDTRPPLASTFTLFKEANNHFIRREYVEAETKLREAVRREPTNTVTRTLLARTLAAENKHTEAKAEIDNILKQPLLPIYTITWTNFTLGEIALATGQGDATNYFRLAVATSKDALPARQKLIEAERAATKLPAVDESVRSFIGQLDRSLREGTNQALDPLILRTNLNKFIRGIVSNKPENWSTEILRAEQITADKAVLDVAITVVGSDKREQHGTAVFILRRNQAGWVLSDIELFNVQ